MNTKTWEYEAVGLAEASTADSEDGEANLGQNAKYDAICRNHCVATASRYAALVEAMVCSCHGHEMVMSGEQSS
jgi:hypothetical protein